MVPTDRKYTREHEWVLIENGIAKIGITDHAQQELGDIVFVELPEVGDSFACGDAIATVESVKAASGIYTLVGGEVVEVNEELNDAPEKINEAAYDTFIVAVKVAEIKEEELLSASEYEALLASEA